MSSSNSAFNLQGAIKPNSKAINPLSLGQSMSSGNPLSNALNAMKIGGQSTPAVKPPAPPSAPTNQQITSHTVNADGSIKQTYATDKSGTSSGTSSGVMTQSKPPVQNNAVSGSLPQYNPNANMQQVNGGSAPQQPQNLYSGLINNLQTTATGNQGIADQAREIASRYSKQYADVGQMGAKAQAGYKTTGTSPVAEGNAAVIAQSTAAQQTALAQGMQGELQGNAQQLTAQNQQATALGAAGGLAQPTQVPYNNQFIDPTTGLPINPNAGADMQSAVALQAQKLRAGTISPQDAANALSAYGQPGVNALQQALGAGFSIPQATGAASATQANAQTGGTASVEANQQIYNDALANSVNLQQQLTNVDQLGSLLLNTAVQGGLNPSDSQFANKSIAQVRSELSNPAQASFDSTMQTLTSKIGLLLNVGGGAVTDQVRNSANSVLSGTLALSALPQVLNQIAAEGQIVAQNQRDVAVKAYQNILQGSQTNPQPQSSGNTGASAGGAGSVKAGGYSFVQDAKGNWIPSK